MIDVGPYDMGERKVGTRPLSRWKYAFGHLLHDFVTDFRWQVVQGSDFETRALLVLRLRIVL